MNKTEPLTAAEVIDRLDEFRGKTVKIVGMFKYHFEHHSIQSGNRWLEDGQAWFGYGSSIWTNFPSNITHFELKKLNGKNVILKGRISRGKHGAGHFSLWPTAINVTHIEAIHTPSCLTSTE